MAFFVCKKERRKDLKRLTAWILAVAIIATSFLGIGLDVNAGNVISYLGKISYGGTTVGHFTIDGQTAFCVEHEKNTPSTGTTFQDQIYGNSEILKVLYYGWGGAAQWSGFESEAHGIVATSLTLSHYYSGTNIKSANQSFYEWLQTQPDAPDNHVYLNSSGNEELDLESYVEGDIQRTQDIVLVGDSRNVVVFPLPDGVTLHNVSSGSVTTGNVGVRCGEKFYLTAPFSMNETWNTGDLKGTLPLYQPVLSVTANASTQNLVRMQATDPTNSIKLNVKWEAVGYLEIQKTDSATGQALAGAVYGIYRDSGAIGKGQSSSLQLVEQLTLDGNGHAISGQLVAGRYYVKEITAPAGYKLDTNTYTYDVQAGQTVQVGVKDERVTGSITVTKKDSVTGNTLSNAEYGLYAADTIVHPDGKTGTLYSKDQLVAKFPPTGIDGKSTVDGLYMGNYYVKEIKAPTNYIINNNSYPVTLSYAGQNVSVVTGSTEATNERVTGSITITKTDKEKGTAQGDATLDGAVYGLYAADTITHPDGKTGTLYSKDQLVAKFPPTEDMGKATLNNLYLGKYYVKEISASKGYLVDDTKYPVTLSYESQNVAVVTASKTVKEQVIKGNIQLVKHLQENSIQDSEKPQVPEVGAEFEVILKSSGKVVQTMQTNTDGFAIATGLPYGTYTIHQTKGKDGYAFIRDFDVVVQANDRTYSYILENRVYSSQLKIVKTDSETGKTVAVAGATFKILDENGDVVEQTIYYPKKYKITEFVTDETGTMVLPEWLPSGNYQLVETKSPDGYLLADPVPFSVKRTDASQDEWGDDVITVECKDDPVKGIINIEKTGKVLTGYKDGKFVYEESGIKDCVFQIKAAETIYSPDHSTDAQGNRDVLYEEGAVVQELTTNGEGKAISEKLPLGKYTVEEISAAYGFVCDSEPKVVELTYKDQETAIVYDTAEVYNEVQNCRVDVVKTDGRTEKPLVGAEFTLYAAQDIVNAKGDVIVNKDDVLDVMVTSDEGKASTEAILPVNAYASEKDQPMYYMVETGVPDGYAANDTKYDVSGAPEEGKQLTVYTKKIVNDPLVVSITKENEEGEAISGAILQVRKKDTKDTDTSEILDSWTSDGKPHKIYNLHSGETYILEEVEPPAGYVTAKPVEFVVEDTTEIQEIKMIDPKSRVSVLKEDENGKPLAGAVLQIKEMESGNVIKEWTTTEEAVEFTDIPIGEYWLVEKESPSGYAIAKDKAFSVKDTPTVQKVTMEDKPIVVEILKIDQSSGEALAGAELVLKDNNGQEYAHWKSTEEVYTLEKIPAGFYVLEEITAPDGYIKSDTPMQIEVTQVEGKQHFEYGNERAELKLDVKQSTIHRTQCGDTYKYCIDKIENSSNCSIEEFTLVDIMPDDATLVNMYTGIYNSEPQEYDILYCTNQSMEWKMWQENISTKERKRLDVSGLNLAEGERVIAFAYQFGNVPEHFKAETVPDFMVTVNDSLDVNTELLSHVSLSGTKLGVGEMAVDDTVTLLWGNNMEGNGKKGLLKRIKTGDVTVILPLVVTVVLSGVTIVWVAVKRRKRKTVKQKSNNRRI